MTTLPQTTALRLPRPNNGAAITPTGPGAMAPGYPGGGAPAVAGFNMTGGDV